MNISLEKKTFKWRHSFLLVPILIFGLQACGSDDDADLSSDLYDSASSTLASLRSDLDSLPLGDLTDVERDGILYMREEEKLARDVYLHLYDVWKLRVFDNISVSEQTHMDAMLLLVERYQLPDPAGDKDQGAFENATLHQLHDDLVADGNASLIDALEVGALIEEVDIIDIQRDIDAVADNDDIVMVYENLMKGSRNHLRAFVRNLETQGIDYATLYLDPGVYEDIVNSPMEH